MTRALFICFFTISTLLHAQTRYAEMYRPQFHATPRSGFMGDPNGPIKFAGKYHLFWWGHLVSEDLVHWTELNANALQGTPSGFGNWSGSVVMDIDNTAGFNTTEDTAMIAVYTLHQDATSFQHQAISVSLNHGSFQYYENNPVITSTFRDFRDPQVFWYEPTGKWVMVITKPIDRAIEVYTSDDLKAWTYRSKFSDRGAKKEIWEVPDLFQLPVNGDPSALKWVMTCGMGPNRMQYWVGDFDGEQFTLDPTDNLISGRQFPGQVFTDFEDGFGDWIVEGEAFGQAPATGTLENQQEVMGFAGSGLANSYHGGDAATGRLISPEFVINHQFVNLLIGGGAGSSVAFRIIVEGQTVESVASTSNTEIMQWRGLDVSAHLGKTAHLEIVDDATGGWGHILVDQIVFSDMKYDTRQENANWADWGQDFYAGKTFRNYDTDDDRTIWLAWMGNWTYARDVPTQPWKGCQSVPRTLDLKYDENGYQLIQKPISELEQLRTHGVSLTNQTVGERYELTQFRPDWNVYEIKAQFRVERDDQVFGLRLAEGGDQRILIRYDAHTSTLTLDRSTTPFSFAYRRISEAPVRLPENGVLDLHILVDQSSVEVFAGDYSASISSLVFTTRVHTGISLFSESGDTELVSLQAWDLSSIWGIQPDQVPVPEEPEPPLQLKESSGAVYPNPIRAGELLHLWSGEPVRVFDLSGNLIFSGQPEAHLLALPASLREGVYMLEQAHSRQKLIIQD